VIAVSAITFERFIVIVDTTKKGRVS